MKKLLGLLWAALVVSVLGVAPAPAQEIASVTTDLNLRAGPGTQYPVITTIPYGSQVRVYGCLRGYSWCDVFWAGTRGWVSARYLGYAYQQRDRVIAEIGPAIGLPIIAFSFGDYAERHYHDRPFYRDWRRRYWDHDHGRWDWSRDRRRGRDWDRDRRARDWERERDRRERLAERQREHPERLVEPRRNRAERGGERRRIIEERRDRRMQGGAVQRQ